MTQTQNTAQDDLLVSLTLHNFSAEMLREFAMKIVKPYFGGNMNAALRCLMAQTIQEETIASHAIEPNPDF